MSKKRERIEYLLRCIFFASTQVNYEERRRVSRVHSCHDEDFLFFSFLSSFLCLTSRSSTRKSHVAVIFVVTTKEKTAAVFLLSLDVLFNIHSILLLTFAESSWLLFCVFVPFVYSSHFFYSSSTLLISFPFGWWWRRTDRETRQAEFFAFCVMQRISFFSVSLSSPSYSVLPISLIKFQPFPCYSNAYYSSVDLLESLFFSVVDSQSKGNSYSEKEHHHPLL